MIKDKKSIYEDKQYMDIVKDIISNNEVQQMKQYRQHYNVSCFDHCLYVSYNLYSICKKHNLDYKSLNLDDSIKEDKFYVDWESYINNPNFKRRESIQDKNIKDYIDEIDSLKSHISNLESQIQELKSQIRLKIQIENHTFFIILKCLLIFLSISALISVS